MKPLRSAKRKSASAVHQKLRAAMLEALEGRVLMTTSWNLANDFSTTNNPAGAWTYGAAPGNQFDAFATNTQSNTGTTPSGAADYWWSDPNTTNNGHVQFFPSGYNAPGTLVIPSNAVSLHPGPNGEEAIVRWTAPATSNYAVAATFTGYAQDNNGTSTDVHVVESGIPQVWGDEVTGYGASKSYNGVLHVSAGQPIDFIVGYGTDGSYVSDNTGLAVTITNSPPQISSVIVPPIAEGQAASFQVTASDPEGNALTYHWNVNNHADAVVTTSPSASLSWAALNALGVTDPSSGVPVSVAVSDGLQTTSQAAPALVVNNVAPTVTNVTLTPALNEGGVAMLSGNISDPGQHDAFTVRLNWGDGSTQTLDIGGSTSFQIPHVYANNRPGNQPYNVSGSLTDGNGAQTPLFTTSSSVLTGDIFNTDFNNATFAPFNPVTASQLLFTTSGYAHSHGGTVGISVDVHNPLTGVWTSVYQRVLTSFQQQSFSGLTINFAPQVIDQVRLTSNPGQTETFHNWGNSTVSTGMTTTVMNVSPLFSGGGDAAVDWRSGGQFTRTLSFIDPGADVWAGTVNYGDGSPIQQLAIDQASKLFVLAHTYSSSGQFPVAVTVQDNDGGSHTEGFVVAVNLNTPPTASTSDAVVDEGGSVELSAAGSSDQQQDASTLTYEWDFDYDGTTFNVDAVGPSPMFSAQGIDGPAIRTVAVRVTDSGGLSDIAIAKVSVNNVPPSAEISSNGPVSEGSPVTVSLTNAFDPSSTDADAGLRYFFSTSQSDRDNATYASAGTANSQQFTFDDNGTYTVFARILDKDGGYTDYSTDVVVNNLSPTAAVSSNGPVNEGSPATVSLGNAFDPSTADTAAGLHYFFSTSQSDRDNATYASSGTDSSQTFNFVRTGTYTVYARVLDKDGGYSDYSTDVRLNNVAPTVQIWGIPTSSTEGGAVTGYVDQLTDPGLPQDSFTYNWSVYKDDPSHTSTPYAAGKGSNYSFTPDEAGTYDVVLTVTDQDGGIGTATATDSVGASSPEIQSLKFSPSDAAGGGLIDENGIVTLTGTYQNMGVNNNETLSIYWGDNNYQTVDLGTIGVNGIVSDPALYTNAEGQTHDYYVVRIDGGWTRAQALAQRMGGNLVTIQDDSENQFVHALINKTAGSDAGTWIGLNDAQTEGQFQWADGQAVGYTNWAPGEPNDGGSLSNPLVTPHSEDYAEMNSPWSSNGQWIDLPDGSHPWCPVDYAVVETTGPAAWTMPTFTLQHQYVDNGTYHVEVRLTSNELQGNLFHTADGNVPTVTVRNIPPTAALSAAQNYNAEGTPIQLTASATDPSPVDTQAGFTYAWTVSKTHNEVVTSEYASGSGPDVNFTPDDDGTYVVTLTATDKDGGVSQPVTESIVVSNVAPTASLTAAPVANPEGTAIALTASAIDPSAADTAAGFAYSWSVTKDGTPFTSGTGATIGFTPDDNGTYLVSVTATDKDGGVSQAVSQAIGVSNVAPSNVALQLSSATINENDSTTLSGTFVDPGVLDSHTVVIDWGDHSSSTTLNLAADVLGFSGITHQYLDNQPGNAPYVISVVVTDKDLDSGSATTPIVVNNVAPQNVTITPNAGNVYNEGSALSFSGSATDPGTLDTLTYGWAVYKNGATTAFASGSGTAFSFTPDDNGSYQVTLTATDKDGASTSASQTYTVNNVAPTLSFSGSTTGARGQDRAFAGSFADPGTKDTWTATVDYGDGSGSQPLALNADKTFNFDHVYTATGSFTVTVKVTDKDGGSGTYTQAIAIKAVDLQTDPSDPTKTALVVGGTTGNDTILFTNTPTGISVTVNGISQGFFKPSGRIMAFGQSGDDIVRVDGMITLPAELYGGDGNDNLTGGGGPNLLMGGNGNDTLIAGNARNVLIGGGGGDTLIGMGGDDLLIAGTTAYDANPPALRAIVNEWARTDEVYSQRVSNIAAGVFYGSGQSARLGSGTVFNDGLADSLTGSGGSDWFLFSLGDVLKDKASGETATQV